MSKQCPLCGKKSQLEWKRKLLRGHYNPTHKVRKYPNLQWARVHVTALKKADLSYENVGENGRRMKICTQCIKGLYKTG